ncbi:hypothetical protein EMIT07CA2_160116 [Brevibacillus sp. IT-7CA2]
MVYVKDVTVRVLRFGDGYLLVGRLDNIEKRWRDIPDGRDNGIDCEGCGDG